MKTRDPAKLVMRREFEGDLGKISAENSTDKEGRVRGEEEKFDISLCAMRNTTPTNAGESESAMINYMVANRLE